MKQIPLTQGQFAIVDDHWFDYLNQWKWLARWDNHTKSYYANRTDRTGQKPKIVSMHRIVAKTPDGMFCDHIHHNTLDNRESELRNVTPSQSMMNIRNRTDNKVGIRGIKKRSNYNAYVAQLNVNGKRVLDKTFKSLQEAINARNKAVEEYFGEFSINKN